MNIEYARTMNKISFDEAIRRGSSGCAAPMVVVQEEFPKPAAKVRVLHMMWSLWGKGV